METPDDDLSSNWTTAAIPVGSISGSSEVMSMTNCTGDDADDYTPYYERLETYLVPFVFTFIFVVGVVGNGTLIVIFVRHKNMRNVPNTYILSLAVADLLVIVTCVPFTSVIYTLESWPWGERICKLSESVKDLSIGVSVFTLTALAAERYCAIVNPLRRFQTKPLTVFSAISIWILAGLCAMPAAIVSNVEEIPLGCNRSIYICSPYPTGSAVSSSKYARYNVAAKALAYYVVPLCIIGCFYLLMADKLHSSARNMPGELAGPQGRAQARARKHVAKLVLAFVVIFIVCFLPYHVFMVWFHFDPNSRYDYDLCWHIVRIVGFCLTYANSCVNPVALYCVSGVFRQHFNRYLFCHAPRRIQRGGAPSINVYLETSFNSTCRRQTQETCMNIAEKNNGGKRYGGNVKIRQGAGLSRQNTQDTSIVPFDAVHRNDRNDRNVAGHYRTSMRQGNGDDQFVGDGGRAGGEAQRSIV